MIEARYNEAGLFDASLDGHLRLVYGGTTLVDGKRFCDYKAVSKALDKWSKPYAGVIWVVPFHIAPKALLEWGACSDLATREADLPPEWKI